MDYYAAVSQILPVLYLAIIVEYRWLHVGDDDPGSQTPLFGQIVYVAKRLLMFLGAVTFAVAEVATLQGLRRGVATESADQAILLAFAVAAVLLVYPLVIAAERATVRAQAWLLGTGAAIIIFLAFRWVVLSMW